MEIHADEGRSGDPSELPCASSVFFLSEQIAGERTRGMPSSRLLRGNKEADIIARSIQLKKAEQRFLLKKHQRRIPMSTSPSKKPSIVFAHGLWADGSCFSNVIPTLQAEGHEVLSTQNSLDSLQGDVAAVTRALGRVSSPVVLVGHSYGGTVITAAGTDDRVAGLVYIAALAPDDGETSQSLLAQFPTTEVLSHIEIADGRIWLLPQGIESFAGDLSEHEQKLVWATQGAPIADLLDQKIEGTAWRSKPSWYIVTTNDHTVHPELQRFVAKRMGATTSEVDSSHVAMLSHPSLVLDVIRAAAQAVEGSSTGE
jgi:pimeloyl-ACP methyl ester carboxylesterase